MQVWREFDVVLYTDPDGEHHTELQPGWEDVATVSVPARTRRKAVIEKGLADARVDVPLGESLRVRVLDVDSSEETVVRSEPRPPQLVIGGAS